LRFRTSKVVGNAEGGSLGTRADSTWCANMLVKPSHRRRGIGSALLVKMLRDDRERGARKSVLLSSHAGALVYPRVG
jgi:GNAT superfamily N-acetyltransferase